SSRRRHTRLQGDWSSDVCSSDLLSGRLLEILAEAEVPPFPLHERFGRGGFSCDVDGPAFAVEVRARHRLRAAPPFVEEVLRILEIGRASCRESVEICGGAVAVR